MINDTLEYLYNLHNRGIKLGLDNIESILSECKNPESNFKSWPSWTEIEPYSSSETQPFERFIAFSV